MYRETDHEGQPIKYWGGVGNRPGKGRSIIKVEPILSTRLSLAKQVVLLWVALCISSLSALLNFIAKESPAGIIFGIIGLFLVLFCTYMAYKEYNAIWATDPK